jgi:hypothetical protein
VVREALNLNQEKGLAQAALVILSGSEGSSRLVRPVVILSESEGSSPVV